MLLFTSRHKFCYDYGNEFLVMSCNDKIVTEIGLVFMTLMLCSVTVEGAKSHKMQICT